MKLYRMVEVDRNYGTATFFNVATAKWSKLVPAPDAEAKVAAWDRLCALPTYAELKHQPDGQWYVWFTQSCTGTKAYATPEEALAAALVETEAADV